MEDVRELKSVLERIEGKLLVARKVYASMNFAIWLAVMSLYYVLMGLGLKGPVESLAYWLGSAVVVFCAMRKIFARYLTLSRRRSLMWRIAVAWLVGSATGWVLIPKLVSGPTSTVISLSILTFLGVSLLGQWAVLRENEIVPSFFLPLLGAPLALEMNLSPEWAGFVLTLGFALTVLLYLHSAFKAMER